MNRIDKTLKTSDSHLLCGSVYEPENASKRVVLIIHGMAEHHRRYDTLARNLCEDGNKVYAFDIRGHGLTGQSSNASGFFSESNGWNRVIQDHIELIDWIISKNPNLDLILFGHSMGSFITRNIITTETGEKIKAAILCGTAGHPGFKGYLGLMAAHLLSRFKGSKTESPFLTNLVFNEYNSHFKPVRTSQDWLNRDSYQVDLFIKDPLRIKVFTNRFFVDLFSGLLKLWSPQLIRQTKTEKLLLIAGENDPLGNHGESIKKLAGIYKGLGVPSVNMKLYPGARHEILLELNKEEVLSDILGWINAITRSKSDKANPPKLKKEINL